MSSSTPGFGSSGSSVPMMDKHALFMGTFVHSKALDELEYLHDTCVAVSAPEGIIVAVEKDGRGTAEEVKSYMLEKLGWGETEEDGKGGNDVVQVTDMRGLGKEGWFFPGFIDTHIHAPQYPNSGLFGKTTLLDWLNTYTFPTEASLGTDLSLARRVYTRVGQQTLSHGTTTASYFATISVDATNLLSAICLARGQRAFVGRVCMDTDLSPPDYRDLGASESVRATLLCLDHCASLDPGRKALVPILTPRFAPSCTPSLLARLGQLAKEKDLPIQTHISENPSEIALARAMFPAAKDYADVYDVHGLLTPRTVLAHCIHLSPRETSVIAERRCGVSHCPVSNSSITSGECPVRSLLEAGVSKIGLGTDVSGGFSPSVLVAARHALLVSRHVAMKIRDGSGGGGSGETEGGGENSKLSADEVLYLATQGGAEVMGLGDVAGSFHVGKSWDAQFVRVGVVSEDGAGSSDVQQQQQQQQKPHHKSESDSDAVVVGGETGPVDLFGTETWEEVIQKWLFTGDDRNTRFVWARGRLVHQKK